MITLMFFSLATVLTKLECSGPKQETLEIQVNDTAIKKRGHPGDQKTIEL